MVGESAYDREGIVRVCVDQKGQVNRKEMTLDIRNRKFEEEPAEVASETPFNYAASNAARLAADEPLNGDVRRGIKRVMAGYEAAPRSSEGESWVDALDDQLLDLMEWA